MAVLQRVSSDVLGNRQPNGEGVRDDLVHHPPATHHFICLVSPEMPSLLPIPFLVEFSAMLWAISWYFRWWTVNCRKEKEAVVKANSLLMLDSLPVCIPAVQHRVVRMWLYLYGAWGGRVGCYLLFSRGQTAWLGKPFLLLGPERGGRQGRRKVSALVSLFVIVTKYLQEATQGTEALFQSTI